MEEKRVRSIIETLALSNSDMGMVLSRVYELGMVEIEKWPDSKHNERVLARRMVLAAGRLIRHRIDFVDLCENREGYWVTPAGEIAQQKLEIYIKRREMRVKYSCD